MGTSAPTLSANRVGDFDLIQFKFPPQRTEAPAGWTTVGQRARSGHIHASIPCCRAVFDRLPPKKPAAL